jgi:glycosyltransferase involved in cell wall biosynthesis
MPPERSTILLLCRMSPRLNGRARALVEALEDDYDVTVVCERPPCLDPVTVFRHARLVESRLAFGTRSMFHLCGAIRLLQMAALGLLHAARNRARVVVCADVPYCFAGLLAKWIWGCCFVFDAHEIIWGMGDGWVFSKLFKLLERLVLKNCDLWLVPSEDRARIVLQEQRLRLPYSVVPNLPIIGTMRTDDMRQSLLRAGAPSDQVTVLFQGTLLPRRGLAELLQAAHTGRFHLIVQGGGPLRSFVAAQAGSNVTLLPPCPNEEAVSWLSAVTASFVYYQNDCINSAYACSSKFYTSMIAGTPVVCNDLPAFRAFAAEHGACLVLERLDSPGIARCIERLAGGEYQALKEQAIEAGRALREFPRAAVLKRAVDDALRPGMAEAEHIPESWRP